MNGSACARGLLSAQPPPRTRTIPASRFPAALGGTKSWTEYACTFLTRFCSWRLTDSLILARMSRYVCSGMLSIPSQSRASPIAFSLKPSMNSKGVMSPE